MSVRKTTASSQPVNWSFFMAESRSIGCRFQIDSAASGLTRGSGRGQLAVILTDHPLAYRHPSCDLLAAAGFDIEAGPLPLSDRLPAVVVLDSIASPGAWLAAGKLHSRRSRVSRDAWLILYGMTPDFFPARNTGLRDRRPVVHATDADAFGVTLWARAASLRSDRTPRKGFWPCLIVSDTACRNATHRNEFRKGVAYAWGKSGGITVCRVGAVWVAYGHTDRGGKGSIRRLLFAAGVDWGNRKSGMRMSEDYAELKPSEVEAISKSCPTVTGYASVVPPENSQNPG